MGLFSNKNNSDGVTRDMVIRQLSGVADPELKKDIVTLEMVRGVGLDTEKGHICVEVQLPNPTAARKVMIGNGIREELAKIKGFNKVDIEFTAGQSPEAAKAQSLTPSVKHIIGVGSGKGGVGKSTVALNTALALAKRGRKVGLLDADIYGPNIPAMMGLSEAPKAVERDGRQLMIPLEKYGVKMISMGVLIPPGQAVIWRGPMLNNVLRQFFGDVEWGEIDELIVDLPPGTGDIQISMVQLVQVTGCVIVSTPQSVSLDDARKALTMFEKTQTPVLGLIENMSYFICDQCSARHEIFDTGGVRAAAEKLELPFLGELPIAKAVRAGGDNGSPVTVGDPEGETAAQFFSIADQLIERLDAIDSGAAGEKPMEIKLGAQ